jgi:uncharacterized protein YggE
MRDWLGGAAAVLLGFAIATFGIGKVAAANERRIERTVSVSATGSVSAEPDIAQISTGVVSEAETAKAAVSRNTALMKRVVDGLKAAGIAAKDIQTTSVNVEPRYQHANDGRSPAIIGYRALNQVQIVARDIAKLGEVLDQAVTLGANQLSGIHFEVSNAETLQDEARKQAMANALRRGKLYATAAGAELGEVLTIAEEVHMGPPRPVPMARSAVAAEAVPIERGSQTLEVKVHVTWALR